MNKTQTIIIPCNGIDSVYGLLSQEIAIRLINQSSQHYTIMGLAYLVNGEVEAAAAINDKQCILINGCKRECATNIVDFIGGEITCAYTISAIAVGHAEVNLGSPVTLTGNGQELVNSVVASILPEINVRRESK
ncbi:MULTISPECIES: putative zinc-binding protein [Sporomusa]|uniref:putative zinc-binding protein n=1 Tax=Sporomusa TaxID=2375 RepID=UPI0016662679|nr:MULTISPECIES: putative zinc-binding protein [Sporomusa]HML35653.1 putative zinc-binding protein [Sporomusa sphaeroides]